MSGPVIPEFARGSECVRENRLFCAHWVRDNWSTVLLPRLVERVELTLVAHRLPRFESPFAVIAIGVALLGTGFGNVLVALVVLAVPPMLTNAYVAVDEADAEAVEAARGMGMSPLQVLSAWSCRSRRRGSARRCLRSSRRSGRARAAV